MTVDHLDAAQVNDLTARIAAARRQASEAVPESRRTADDADYWQSLFEANASAVLGALPRVSLSPGHEVRYRFYGRTGSDLRVRPFVTRTGTDVAAVLRLFDWHAAPDAGLAHGAGDRDVELLYRHFTFERSALGYFEYWLALQELWASQRWIHSTIVADAAQFAQLTGGPDWRVERPVERVEPALVSEGDDAKQIAVLVHCPIDRHTVTFHRVRIAPDQRIEYADSLLVAHGPRGYMS